MSAKSASKSSAISKRVGVAPKFRISTVVNSASSSSTIVLSKCKVDVACRSPPLSMRSGLVRSTRSMALSAVTAEDNSRGRILSSDVHSRERWRVSSKNSPSAAGPAAWAFPNASRTAKLLPFFSTRRPWFSTRTVAGIRNGETTSIAPERDCGWPYSGSNHPPQRSMSRDQTAVDIKIILGHPPRGEAFLKDPSDAGAIQMMQTLGSTYRLFLVIDDKTGDAVVADLGNRAVAERDHRRAARHRLDHGETEGLAPGDRKQQCRGVAKELRLLCVVDLPDELDMGCGAHRLDALDEILLGDLVPLGRPLAPHTAPPTAPHPCTPCLLRPAPPN